MSASSRRGLTLADVATLSDEVLDALDARLAARRRVRSKARQAADALAPPTDAERAAVRNIARRTGLLVREPKI